MDKKPRIPPFTVTLSDVERERLDAHRAALGLRSLADVVRHWINSGPVVWTQDGVTTRLSERVSYSNTEMKQIAEASLEVPVLQRKPFLAHPKPNKR